MASLDFLHTKEAVFDFFEDYAADRKQEIDEKNLGDGTGLIKTYMLETEREFTNQPDKLVEIFDSTDIRLSPFDEAMFVANFRKQHLGFVEVLSSRHVVMHTILKTNLVDRLVNNVVSSTPQLDHVWLSGYYLNQVWEKVVKHKNSNRRVKFTFHQNDYFDEGIWQDIESSSDDDLTDDDSQEYDAIDAGYNEGIGSSITYADKIGTVTQKWDGLRQLLPAFRSINMLRLPADEVRGGYDFWNEGKVTHRSPSFVDGREHVRWMTSDYQRLTEIIEKKAWLQSLEIPLGDENNIYLSGTPISFIFKEPLETHIFLNFIDKVFNKRNRFFRLWGNPLQVSKYQYQVYGLDMHLWQRIYLDLTPERFVLVLPQGTCGNTVHRLANNIQEYLSPEVNIYIGDEDYEQLIGQVILGRYANG